MQSKERVHQYLKENTRGGRSAGIACWRMGGGVCDRGNKLEGAMSKVILESVIDIVTMDYQELSLLYELFKRIIIEEKI